MKQINIKYKKALAPTAVVLVLMFILYWKRKQITEVLKVDDMNSKAGVAHAKKNTQLFWNSIQYFKAYEFDSSYLKDSGYLMKPHFIRLLDEARARVGFPISISSGFRTRSHNNSIVNKNGVKYSATDSPHLYGIAADLVTDSKADTIALMTALLDIRNEKYPDMHLGIGVYGSSSRSGGYFIHVDTREHRLGLAKRDAHWTGNSYPSGGYRMLPSSDLRLFDGIYNSRKK